MKYIIFHFFLITAVIGSSFSQQTPVVFSEPIRTSEFNTGSFYAIDAVHPNKLKHFDGSCTLNVPTVFEEGELCATVVFDDATYGLTTGDKFSVLERKNPHGAHSFKIYRFTNTEKITAGRVGVHFMSWHKTNSAQPKYTCELESTAGSNTYKNDGNQLEFANEINFATPLTTADGISYNMIGNFQGSCTFDVSTNLAKGELSVAVIFSADTYGIQVGQPFQVLLREDIQAHSPQRIYRITNSVHISFDQLKIGFFGWYNMGRAKATYTCKLESSASEPTKK